MAMGSMILFGNLQRRCGCSRYMRHNQKQRQNRQKAESHRLQHGSKNRPISLLNGMLRNIYFCRSGW
jgi:hypothetical protein